MGCENETLAAIEAATTASVDLIMATFSVS
jgi:hypothetical protein